MRYEHVLTIGTTGMLAQATQALAEQSRVLTCVARTEASLERLQNRMSQVNCEFRPVAVDYHDENLFTKEVEQAWRHAPFDLVLAWMHSSARASFEKMSDFLARRAVEIKLFHVVGSAATNPAQTARDQVLETDNLSYHQVILGFQIETSGSRWLTHDEISRGTLQAIREGHAQHVIGTVEPWAARP